MTTLRLTKMEIQELRLWGETYKQYQEVTGMKFEDDQQRLLDKLDESVSPKKEVKE